MMFNFEPVAQAESLKRYTAKTFGWMFLGLAVTFGVMMATYYSGAVFFMMSTPVLFILAAAELGTVIVLSARVGKMSVGASRALFFFYAILNGLVFSTYFLYFHVSSLMLAFGVTSLYFGVMAGVGYFTKVDLSRLQPLLIGGLILIIVLNVLGIFFGFGGMERLLCFAGVALFLGFTAYDTQKIKALHAAYSHDPSMLARVSIFAALQLYLDFINLFLYILRLFNRD
ncbi:Bax inhibitor-1/YccA family protein [Intestinibacillus sp. Marseille-P6563]|uniref:Bax inhibitor-1/YccA family protein n=1 Tax=Intestinibacillus sp. Marseille-P6563 TaxID=2364792 RepID=UPI000F07131B|nr:Bax inhibitor-1/YccA family protein [Intestinibacillus sp. Marseille-P6563]